MGAGVIKDSWEERMHELPLLSLFEIDDVSLFEVEDVDRVTHAVVMVSFLGGKEYCNRADLLCARFFSTSFSNMLLSSLTSVHSDDSFLDTFFMIM